jgi:beta-N-acetylhexosaminidase
MTLEDLIGRTLVFGISGMAITGDEIRLYRETGAGGLILYRRNFESTEQLKQLISRLEETIQRRLLVMTDHEGGRVVMFREGVTVFPDNLAFGAAGRAEDARRQGAIEAKELRRLGVDVNLAPVLDVLTESYSPNIGIRSYGPDPGLVAQMGEARIRAMQAGGLSACAKHFPGKGHSPLDAHLRLPTILSTWKEMRECHLIPFERAIRAGVEMIMTSHPLYPSLDPTPNCPATFSIRIVKETLRDEMNYQGVIASDDLEMGAIGEISPIREAGVHARRAGHDLLLACHDLRSQWALFQGLLDSYKTKALPLGELEESVERIGRLRARRPVRFEGGAPGPEPEGAAMAREVSLRAVTVLRPGVPGLSRRPRGIVAVIFPRLSDLDPRIMVERPLLDEEGFLLERFGRFGIRPLVKIVGIEPSEDEIADAESFASRSEIAILFLFDAHLFPTNKSLLERLQTKTTRLVVALMRDPYDVEFIREGVLCLTSYGYRVCQLDSVIERLLGEEGNRRSS